MRRWISLQTASATHYTNNKKAAMASSSTSGQKVMMVTGASSGIGKEITRQLGKQGYHVVMAVRSESKGKAAIQDIGIIFCSSWSCCNFH